MLDVFNIPGQQDNVKIFYAAGTTAWQTWQKPRNCKFIWMMCIGGGSGGGGGGITSGIQAGATGATTRALFPASVLPDTLFVQPGPGGVGGTPNLGAGGNGNRSWVVINPSGSVPAVMNTVCISGTTAAVGASNGVNGVGETPVTTSPVVAGLLSLGNFTSTAGTTSAGAVTVTPFGTNQLCVGGNGGTQSVSGGSGIASVNFITFQTPALSGGAISSGADGANGVFSWKPFYSLGGAGGGSNNAGAGGKGGNGAYGSGGGGGGGGSTGGGAGGNGGDGLVVIVTF